MYGPFRKQSPAQVNQPKELTDAESVAIEVKRGESQHMIDRGSRQLQSYMSEAYGFYDEAYLAGPFIKGPGTVSVDEKGRLSFERPTPSTSTADTDYWRQRKAQQFQDVKMNMVLELLKNHGISEIVEACGGKEKVQTYEDLLRAAAAVDIGELVMDP
jgi:hypothetical protein